MMKRFSLVAALVALSTAAGAYTITVGPMPSDLNVFDDVAIGMTGTFASQGIEFSGDGIVLNIAAPEGCATPYGDKTNFLCIPAGGTEDIDFAKPRTSFTIYQGSNDVYNSWTINGIIITGTDLPSPACADQSWTDACANIGLTFSGFGPISQVVEHTGFCCQESDMAASIPETPGWLMLMLGFASLGLVGWRKRAWG